MAEYNETEFNVEKKDVVQLCDRISKFLMKDFDKKFNQHKSLDHKWFIQGTIHGVCRGLFVDKQVAVYLILGSNPRRPGWGELKKKYDIDPIKFMLRREVVTEGKKLLNDHGFKVFFTDTNRNGDFHMKVVFYPYKADGAAVASDSEGFTTVKSKGSKGSKEGFSYAGAAYRGKDKPAPAPLADPKKVKPVLPTKSITILAEESDEGSVDSSTSSK